MCRRRALAAVAVGVLTATAGLVLLGRVLRADALVRPEAREQKSADGAAVGETWHFGFNEFAVKEGRSAEIEAINVLGVPDGLEVVSISVHERIVGFAGVGVLSDESIKAERLTPARVPRGIELREDYGWQVVIAVRADRAGTFVTNGLQVKYRTGGRRGSQSYPYRIRLVAS